MVKISMLVDFFYCDEMKLLKGTITLCELGRWTNPMISNRQPTPALALKLDCTTSKY